MANEYTNASTTALVGAISKDWDDEIINRLGLPRKIFGRISTPGTKLELYPLDLLAKDIDPGNPPAPGSGFGGITLAYNTITKEEVVEI